MLLSEMKELLSFLEGDILDRIDENSCECYADGVRDGIATFVDELVENLEEIAEI